MGAADHREEARREGERPVRPWACSASSRWEESGAGGAALAGWRVRSCGGAGGAQGAGHGKRGQAASRNMALSPARPTARPPAPALHSGPRVPAPHPWAPRRGPRPLRSGQALAAAGAAAAPQRWPGCLQEETQLLLLSQKPKKGEPKGWGWLARPSSPRGRPRRASLPPEPPRPAGLGRSGRARGSGRSGIPAGRSGGGRAR